MGRDSLARAPLPGGLENPQEEVLAHSSQLSSYTTNLTDKGRTPTRPAAGCPIENIRCAASARLRVPVRPARHVRKR